MIRDGKVVALGRDVRLGERGVRVVNLRDRTAIPGLIDNHIHFLRLANLPAYTVRRLEGAFTVEAAQEVISERAKEVPRGAFITLLGAITQGQFAEGRFPNLDELDDAAPHHPVYISRSGSGPGQTNTVGRDALVALGVPVGADGVVASGSATSLAFERLSVSTTDEDRQRQLLDEADFALSVGLTTVLDMSGTVPGVGFLDQATGYDFYLDLVRRQRLPIRTRIYFPGFDNALPLATLQDMLDHRWREYGPDLARVVGVGEWSVGRQAFSDPLGEVNRVATRLIGERGWPYHQHVISADEIDGHLTLWEELRAEGLPIEEMHWSLGHLDGLTEEQVARANDLGVGLGLHPWRYLGGNALPPFRMAVDLGEVAVGGGSDGARISTLNPWNMIYAMVTGRNNAGEPVGAAGQQISRKEAVRLFTSSAQGWFAKEEDTLGGIEVGRFADLVVLRKDIFDPREVSDEEIRSTTSVLTIVGGEVVHDAGVVKIGKS